jgi:hypothetical protein
MSDAAHDLPTLDLRDYIKLRSLDSLALRVEA